VGHLPGASDGNRAVVEDRAAGQAHSAQLDAGAAQQVELVCLLRLGVNADERAHGKAEACGGKRPIGDAAAKPPAARIGRIEVAAGSPDDKHGRRRGAAYTRIVYFYELSESDDEIFANVLLAHDAEYDEQEFLQMVLESRVEVLKSFEDDSLIEGVAADLERRHGFVQVEANLRAAVRISAEEGETQAVPTDERAAAMPTEEEDFRSMLIEVEPEDRPYREG
jgi:hypothetical protein